MPPREIAFLVLSHELGRPYRWGGDDPVEGFDCSGLMSHALRSAGKLGPHERLTAEQLGARFPATTTLRPGVLVLYERTRPNGQKYLGHVEMVFELGTPTYAIGASGGGSKTVDDAAAAAANAFVQIHPLTPGYVRAVDPFQ